jgi:hypothetical protein
VGLLAALAVCGLLGAGFSSSAQAATWCGTVATDDRPATVGGRQVRIVYAIPSDGADRSATVVPQLSADVDAIEGWWQSQDATRTVRFDRTAFTCGLQADVELLRLTQTAAQLQPTDGRFEAVADAVTALDGDSSFLKYLVYYDGPSADNNLCGQGGGFFDGPGVAIVYVGSCSGEPSVVVAAHELLHAMGALPGPGPPHACTESNGGDAHACDANLDLMWPFATLVPLSQLILDVNRDDYYAHAGSWPDMQDSGWLRHLDAQSALTVALQGRGAVTSNLPGVACTASCTTEWDTGSSVTLTATPAAGQKLAGWAGGGCTGTSTCTVTLTQATQVGVLFGPPTFALRVGLTGRGVVRGAAGRVACPSRCAVAVPSYTATRLVATPRAGWRFKSWSGACRGTRPTCTVPMRKAISVRAVFARKR